MPKRVIAYKDESREEQKRAQKRVDAIVTVEVVLSSILSKPSVWDEPNMINIMSMVCQIGRDREKFPLPLDEDLDN